MTASSHVTITGVRSGAADGPALKARRFALSYASMRWLDERLPGALPPLLASLIGSSSVAETEDVDPVAELNNLGLLDSDEGDEQRPRAGEVLRTTWGVLTAPRFAVMVEISGRDVGRVGVLARRGRFGVGIVQLGGREVEVSGWSSERLGEEVARLVPPVAELGRRRSIAAQLSGDSGSDHGSADSRNAVALSVTRPALPEPVARLTADVVVSGPVPAAGRLTWAATAAGWWHVVARDAEVWADPVSAADLGREVNRLLAAAVTYLPASAPTAPTSTPGPAHAPAEEADGAAHREMPGEPGERGTP